MKNKGIADYSTVQNWRSFRVVPSMSVKYVSPHKEKRMILINPVFWAKMNDYQRIFLLMWSRHAYKSKNVKKADAQAKKEYVAMGYELDHILKIYATITHGSKDVKDGRIVHLITHRIGWKDIFKRFILKVKLWLKKQTTKDDH